MSFSFRLASPLLVLVLLGCTPNNSANAVSGASDARASRGTGSASSSGTRNEPIKDPTLDNMTAYDIKIPAKWHFRGVLYQGGKCTPTPSGVYRATSPDGLSYVESMPPLSWQWGTGPAAAQLAQNDCLPIRGPMSAQDFLKHLALMMKVQYLAPDPAPAEETARAQAELQNIQAVMAPKYAAARIQQPKGTVELARAIVGYKNGTFAMKGRLNLRLDCSVSAVPGQRTLGPWGGPGHPPQMVMGAPSTIDKCTASVIYFTAPESQFAAAVRQWDAYGMGVGAKGQAAWQQAWIQRNAAQTQQTIAEMTRMSQAAMQASAQNFAHDQVVRQQMHEQFMDTMQRGTDISMANTQASMNARSTAASDVVDYALDQRTVADPNTGQLTKISNQAATAWSDNSGQMYISKDPNANPNGSLPGTWVQQNYTHGDGTPQ